MVSFITDFIVVIIGTHILSLRLVSGRIVVVMCFRKGSGHQTGPGIGRSLILASNLYYSNISPLVYFLANFTTLEPFFISIITITVIASLTVAKYPVLSELVLPNSGTCIAIWNAVIDCKIRN